MTKHDPLVHIICYYWIMHISEPKRQTKGLQSCSRDIHTLAPALRHRVQITLPGCFGHLSFWE